MTNCKSCGAEILWADTENGKRMPVDVEPVAGGTIVLRHTEVGLAPVAMVTSAEERELLAQQAASRGEELRLFVSHFATCEHADLHRSRKEPAMTPTATAPVTSAPLSALRLDDANPRTDIDPDGIHELAASIKQHGVLQPLLVRPDGDGYLVVAGQRRLLAAAEAGLTDVPIHVRDTNGDAGTVAIVENLQRQDLNPIEQADAFQKAIAGGMTVEGLVAALNVSEQLVRDRLALLKLPDTVQKTVADGTVPLRATKELARIAEISPPIAAAVAAAIADTENGVTAGYLEDQPDDAISDALADADENEVWCQHAWTGYGRQGVGDFNFPADQVHELTEALGTLPGSAHQFWGYGGKGEWPLQLSKDDVDAARAYGCLLEFKDSYRTGWITDREWLVDRFKLRIEQQQTLWAKEQKRLAREAAKAGPAGAPVADAKEAAKALRAKERADSLAARERNVSLGIALYKELHAPAPTLENMQLLALLILQYAGEDIGRRGLRFVDEQSQTVTTRKDGTISRVTHLRGTGECRALLEQRIRRAKTPEQMLGVLLQALVAAQFADPTAAASSDRYGHVRGLGDHHGYGQTREIVDLIGRIGEPVLPPDVVEKVKARRLEFEQERQQQLATALVDVRAGMVVCPSCGANRGVGVRGPDDVTACACTDEEILAAFEQCPRCGEPDCEASCSGFDTADQAEEPDAE